MNSIKNDVNLKEEVKERCFEVCLSWYEIHDGKVRVKASSHEEARRIVEEDICRYIDLAKLNQETYSDTTTEEVYDTIAVKEETKKEDDIYRDKFDKDVYITTTSYHSSEENNILEIGKVKYRDYVHGEKRKYKFSKSNNYSEQYDYYDIGACPSRNREEALFETGDYSRLLSKSLCKVEEKYSFAKSIEEAIDKGKYILVMKRNSSNSTKSPRTLQIMAVKILNGSERRPFKIDIANGPSFNFHNREGLEKCVISSETILGYNNTRFNLFLYTQEGLRMLNETVIESIGYTL